MTKHGIVGLAEIDTRALVRHIRSRGAMKGVLSTTDLDNESLIAKAKASPGLAGRDLVKEVIPDQAIEWDAALSPWSDLTADISSDSAPEAITTTKHIVAVDFGMKWNIARHLRSLGCRVTVVPGDATAEDVLSHESDGVFLSNGPGDPEPLTYAHEMIRAVMQKLPVFGICLGHQLLALACGAKTFKMKFGHRGGNQPVQNCLTGKIEITAQNHGFAVEESSLPADLEVTHRNLNDNTVAGLRHKTLPAFSVQYHPEASSGPHDSRYLFNQFWESL